MTTTSIPRDQRDLAKRAAKQGWRIEQGGKHLKWYSPDGQIIIVSSVTPSDWRSHKNLEARLKRAGVWKDE